MVRTAKSQNLYNSAFRLITGGVHSGFRFRDPYPLYFERAKGSRVWDIDGNEYVDCLVGNGSCILGHSDPDIIMAVKKQLETGMTVGLETELSIEVAKLLQEMVPSAQSVKLANTGTEAVMHAIQIARGFTGKNKIIKTEGCYHGWQDELHFSVHPKLSSHYDIVTSPAEVSPEPVPEGGGYPPASPMNVAVIPYNDSAALERYLKENGSKVAAMIVEPVLFNSGCIMPKAGYLQELREITQRYGVLLIFDEIITGFRISPGGAQKFYDVIPDMSVLGKAIANGFPLSAVVAKEEVMNVTTPRTGSVGFSGTYNANQPSLAAAKACLNRIKDGTVQRKLAQDIRIFEKRFRELKNEVGVNALFQGLGGQFQIYFTDEDEISNYKMAAMADLRKYVAFSDRLLSCGVLFHQSHLFHHGTSWAHDENDLERILSAFKNGLETVTKLR